MRKFIILLIIAVILAYVYINRAYWFLRPYTMPLNFERYQYKEEPSQLMTEGLALLKARRDAEAWINFTKILIGNPNDLDALWGKAEILRRTRKYDEAEAIFKQIITEVPKHAPALLSLAYLRYKDDRLNEAQKLVADVLQCYLNKDNEALAYMMLGTINSRRATRGGIIAKLNYGTQIKCYLIKAKELAPDLPEVHLALGSFYLLASPLIGGNMTKAYEELNMALKLAPDFATVTARLAQYYRKRGDFENYGVFLERTEELDPENEVLKEIRNVN